MGPERKGYTGAAPKTKPQTMASTALWLPGLLSSVLRIYVGSFESIEQKAQVEPCCVLWSYGNSTEKA